jgi:hypothetical protein
MTRHNLILPAISALVLSAAPAGRAQEGPVQKSDLPAVVRKTADDQSKGATVRGYEKETENGQVEYEVKLTVNGHPKDVAIDAKSNILAVEEEAALDKLLAAVREALHKRLPPAQSRK